MYSASRKQKRAAAAKLGDHLSGFVYTEQKDLREEEEKESAETIKRGRDILRYF